MFNVYDVPAESAEFSEQMGTKFKFWYQDSQLGLTLFKEGRPGTGENWAEKITAELALLLGLPHASYELAQWRDRGGVISPVFVPEGARLIHGNELVGGKVTVASQDTNIRYYRERTHTASRVFQYLKLSADSLRPPVDFVHFEGVDSALGVFIGYLMFDVWIANQDRHSENWGIIRTIDQMYLAPTYDHGSSLGRQETDERRRVMLTTRDHGASISAYSAKARSAMYPNAAGDIQTRAYFNLDLFELACKMDVNAAKAWIAKLSNIAAQDVVDIVNQVPENLMTDVARNFTVELLQLNKNRILAIKT